MEIHLALSPLPYLNNCNHTDGIRLGAYTDLPCPAKDNPLAIYQIAWNWSQDIGFSSHKANLMTSYAKCHHNDVKMRYMLLIAIEMKSVRIISTGVWIIENLSDLLWCTFSYYQWHMQTSGSSQIKEK